MPADLSKHPTARKLVAAAETAGLKFTTGQDEHFVRVAIASKDGTKILCAEWWNIDSDRSHNYTTVEDRTTRKSKRADSLAQARAQIGL